MALTRSFKETVLARVQSDPAFGDALLQEGIEAFLSGEVEVGKALLRDYIKATVGFEQLGEQTGSSPKSLIRMFGPTGNPQARNLFNVVHHLQLQAGLAFHVIVHRPKAAAKPFRTRMQAVPLDQKKAVRG